MTLEEFWRIVEGSRASSCAEIAAGVQRQLDHLPVDEIADFCRHFDAVQDSLYTWDLWGVAYIVKGGASDDDFEYFRAWVITKGRDAVSRAINEPEGFGLSIERSTDPFDLECEDLIYTGRSVFESRTGEYGPDREEPNPATPAGETWDETSVAARFPRLAAAWGWT